MSAPTVSYVFGANIVSALNNSIALNLSDGTAGTFKYTLWQNTMTSPTISSDTGNYGTSPWTLSGGSPAGEVANSGTYSAGGVSLTTPTFTVDTTGGGTQARMLWKDTATSFSLTTFSGTPYGGMARWEAGATDYGIVYHYWGATPVVSGTLTVTWNATYLAGTLFYIPFAA